MKKSLLAMAALCALTGAAHAQSSVTLYGVLDQSLNWQNNANGKSQFSMASGMMQGSRFGLRGAEDLGGGMKAIFVLESGFNGNNGQSGQGGLLFGRQAFVGLATDKYGTVTFGRQYDSVVDFVAPLAMGSQWGAGISAHPGDVDNFNNSYRTNNTIKYTSLNYAGFNFGATYSVGGVAGKAGRNQIWSLGASYANGPVVLSAGYLQAKNPNTSFFTNRPTDTARYNVLDDNPVYGGYASARTYQVIGAGAAYSFGPATIGTTYSNVRFKDIGDRSSVRYARGQGNASFDTAEISLMYQLTAATQVGIGYAYTRGSSIDNQPRAQYHQVSLGAGYALSKRTDVYAVVSGQQARGVDSTGESAVASINGLKPSDNHRVYTATVGLRHKF